MPDIPPIVKPEAVTAKWLTSVLQAGGHLGVGKVAAVQVEPYRRKPNSNLVTIVARYEPTIPGLPTNFMLKIARNDVSTPTAIRRRRREHVFYSQLAPAMTDPPVPRCYSAVLTPDARAGHLLLEDLSDSTTRPPRGLPSSPQQALGAMTALATMHAAWWQDAELIAASDFRDDAWYADRERTTLAAGNAMLEQIGPYLAPSMRDAIIRAMDAWPRLLRGHGDPLTLAHGDAHPWNCLTPRDGGPTLLLDWEGWAVEPATYDLAAFISSRFDLASQLELTHPMLRRYHDTLIANGIALTWDDLRASYGRAVLRRVMTPVTQWKGGEEPEQWWNMLSRVSMALIAIEDGTMFAAPDVYSSFEEA